MLFRRTQKHVQTTVHVTHCYHILNSHVDKTAIISQVSVDKDSNQAFLGPKSTVIIWCCNCNIRVSKWQPSECHTLHPAARMVATHTWLDTEWGIRLRRCNGRSSASQTSPTGAHGNSKMVRKHLRQASINFVSSLAKPFTKWEEKCMEKCENKGTKQCTEKCEWMHSTSHSQSPQHHFQWMSFKFLLLQNHCKY